MPEDSATGEITLLLRRTSAGDKAAESDLAEIVYDRVRTMAHRIVNDGGDISLQPTGLVNSVLLELVRTRTVDWNDREHFFRTASRMLRHRLIDHIRARRASRRPPPGARGEIEDYLLPTEERFDEILDVHQGLQELAEFDPELAELVELVYFGGCTVRTIAEMRNQSPRTVTRHLDLAESWLKARFSCPPAAKKSAVTSEP